MVLQVDGWDGKDIFWWGIEHLEIIAQIGLPMVDFMHSHMKGALQKISSVQNWTGHSSRIFVFP